MLPCVIIYTSSTGNNLEPATDVGLVCAWVPDLFGSWASKYLDFWGAFYCLYRAESDSLYLHGAAWKWCKIDVKRWPLLLLFNVSGKQSPLAPLHVIRKVRPWPLSRQNWGPYSLLVYDYVLILECLLQVFLLLSLPFLVLALLGLSADPTAS